MPSVVSISDIPAANRAGNTMIDQIGRPWAAWVAETPIRATSVAVSKPSPNRKPRGNMCQLLETTRKTGRNRRASRPRLFSSRSKSSSARVPPPRTWRNAFHTPARIATFMAAMTNRNSVETSVPTTLPTLLKVSKRDASAVAVAAIPPVARITTAEWPRAKKKPTLDGTLAVLHQFAGDVVDGGDVIGVDRVA